MQTLRFSGTCLAPHGHTHKVERAYPRYGGRDSRNPVRVSRWRPDGSAQWKEGVGTQSRIAACQAVRVCPPSDTFAQNRWVLLLKRPFRIKGFRFPHCLNVLSFTFTSKHKESVTGS